MSEHYCPRQVKTFSVLGTPIMLRVVVLLGTSTSFIHVRSATSSTVLVSTGSRLYSLTSCEAHEKMPGHGCSKHR